MNFLTKAAQNLIGYTIAMGIATGLVVAPAFFSPIYADLMYYVAMGMGLATFGLGITGIIVIIVDLVVNGW